MTRTPHVPTPGSSPDPVESGSVTIDQERLDCYRVARELHLLIMGFPLKSAVRDQLERASLSVVLNLAEGCGVSGGARVRHFGIARGSAIDIISLRGVIIPVDARKARGLAVRCIQMLSRLQGVAGSRR